MFVPAGKVALVVAVDVNVVANAPAVIKEPPSTIVRVEPVAGAVIVNLLIEVAVATPKTGVTKVGVVANTKTPEPVSSETAPEIAAEAPVDAKTFEASVKPFWRRLKLKL